MMIRTDKRRGRTLGFRARSSAQTSPPPQKKKEKEQRIKIIESSDQSSVTSATSMDNSQTIGSCGGIDTTTTTTTTTSWDDLQLPPPQQQDWRILQLPLRKREVEKLEAFEKRRSNRVVRKMELMHTQIAILQDLTTESDRETSAAYRFAVGISKAQQTLASALVLPKEEEDDDDDDDEPADDKINNQSMEAVSDLEEIIIPGKSNDETSLSAAAVIDKRENSTVEEEEDPKKKKNIKPMVGSLICFPNPAAKREAGFVVHHEQDALQQLVARANISTESIADAQQSTHNTHEIVTTNQIMTVLQQIETEIQVAWSAYQKTTKELFSDPDTIKCTWNDAWVAERQYRQAVTRQQEEWPVQEQCLRDLVNIVKENEGTRRILLRQNLKSIVEKQATVFQRIYQSHEDALQDWFQNQEQEGTNEHDADEKKQPEQDCLTTSPSLTIKERIEQIAEFSGATTVWDDDETKEQKACTTKTTVPSWKSTPPPKKKTVLKETTPSGIDVDQFMNDAENSKNDDDELPRLPTQKTRKSSKKCKKNQSTRQAHTPTTSTKNFEGLNNKPKNSKPTDYSKLKESLVLLDSQSQRNAYYLDKLLFADTLLVSHYVKFVTLADMTFEEDRLTLRGDDGTEGEAKTHCDAMEAKMTLVIVTCDQTLHFFEIPSQDSDAAYESELKPHEILRLIVERSRANEMKWKLRPQGNCVFTTEFTNLVPTVSLPSKEYIVRMTRRGESLVKIISKSFRSELYDRTGYNKVKLGLFSPDKQKNLFKAITGEES